MFYFLGMVDFFFLTEVKFYTNNKKIGRLVYILPRKEVQTSTSNSLCARIRIDSKTLTV